MALSLIPGQQPIQRMQTVSIDEILLIGEKIKQEQPPLEFYFSPTRKDQFIKDYIHFLNTELLEAKHGRLDKELFLMFILSFQFTSPLLKIPAEKELGLFVRILEKNYSIQEPDLNLYFTLDDYDEEMVGEEEALTAYRNELSESYEGFREVRESIRDRLKKDGIAAIMNWQKEKDLPSLAEAFGRSVVIPSFFNFMDKRLVSFYRRATEGISYEVALPKRFKPEIDP